MVYRPCVALLHSGESHPREEKQTGTKKEDGAVGDRVMNRDKGQVKERRLREEESRPKKRKTRQRNVAVN